MCGARGILLRPGGLLPAHQAAWNVHVGRFLGPFSSSKHLVPVFQELGQHPAWQVSSFPGRPSPRATTHPGDLQQQTLILWEPWRPGVRTRPAPLWWGRAPSGGCSGRSSLLLPGPGGFETLLVAASPQPLPVFTWTLLPVCSDSLCVSSLLMRTPVIGFRTHLSPDDLILMNYTPKDPISKKVTF